LYLPMIYAIKKLGKFEGEINEGKDIDITFKGALRDYQSLIIQKTLETLKIPNGPSGSIVCAATGQGKTVMGINLICKLKKKCLIVVHKEFLMNQWVERIKEFAPNTKIGIIQGNKCETEEKDVVIGMLQSIVLRDYPKKTFSDFGFIIYDEVHHLSGKVFSNSFFKIGTIKYSLGLSATPERKDGLTKIIEWHLGEIFVPDNNDLESSTTEIHFYNLVYKTPPIEELNKMGKINLPCMITDLTNFSFRNEMIIKTILKTEGKMLVLSDRITHLKYIYSQLEKKKHSKTFGLYIGKMKKDELQVTNECDVILGSYSMCSEGYDCPDLNVLFMITPKSEITQIIGRIFRKKHSKHIIIDFCDNYSVFKVQGFKRKRIYKKLLPDSITFNIRKCSCDTVCSCDADSPENIEFLEE